MPKYIIRNGGLALLQEDGQSTSYQMCPFAGAMAGSAMHGGRCGTTCPLFELQDHSGNELMKSTQTAVLHCAPLKREIEITDPLKKG